MWALPLVEAMKLLLLKRTSKPHIVLVLHTLQDTVLSGKTDVVGKAAAWQSTSVQQCNRLSGCRRRLTVSSNCSGLAQTGRFPYNFKQRILFAACFCIPFGRRSDDCNFSFSLKNVISLGNQSHE